MRTSNLLAMLVVWGMAGSVDAAFTDDFESYTAPSFIVGQGGWQSGWYNGAAVPNGQVIAGVGFNGSQGVLDSTYNSGQAGAGRNIGGATTISIDVFSDGDTTSQMGLGVGESASVLALNASFNEVSLFMNGAGAIVRQTYDGGNRTSLDVVNGALNWPAIGWVRMEIVVDRSGAGSAVGSVYDINDTNGDILSTIYSESFPGNMPAFEAAAFMIASGDYAFADNFSLGGVDTSRPQWLTSGVGDWNGSGNWTLGGPAGTAEQTALFGGLVAGPTLVGVNSPVTINGIEFNNSANGYVIAGHESVNLKASAASQDPSITVDGTHEFQARVNLLNDTTADVPSGSTLIFNNALDLMGNTLTKTGDGEVAIRNDLITSGGTIDVQGGTVSGNGTISGNVNNSAGVLSPGNISGSMEINGQSNIPEPASSQLVILAVIWLVAVCRTTREIAIGRSTSG